MAEPSWEPYEISLSPQPAKAVVVPRMQPVVRPLASRAARFLAAVMDRFLYALPVGAAFAVTQRSGETSDTTAVRLTIWLLGWALIAATQITLLTQRGQTIGKLGMGLRIVDYADESNPDFVHVVLLRSIIPACISVVPCLGQLFVLIDLLSIFGEERRCIHDQFAGTKVVEC